MSNTAKSSHNKAGNFKSFFEELAETAKNEAVLAGDTAKNTLLGRKPLTPHEGLDRGPLSPEIPHKNQKENKKTPEIKLFSYPEHYENMNVKAEIQSVLKEIRHMIVVIDKEQKGLLNDMAKITVEQVPHASVYHLTFLEFVLRTLKDIRKTVSESATWLAALSGKNKKMGYHGMAKKHGTSFTQNNERAVATQSG